MASTRTVPILRARIDKGRVCWQGIDGKKWETAKVFLEGKEVEITIQKRRKRTTAPQRKYYFAVIVYMICEASGHDPDDPLEIQATHEALKWRFLLDNSGALPMARSTERLTTVERETYHEQCRRFAAEQWGLYIPLPNEVELQ